MYLDTGSSTRQPAALPPFLPPALAPRPETLRLPTPVEAAVTRANTGSPVERGAALRDLDALTGNRGTTDALVRGVRLPAMSPTTRS